MDAHTLSVAQLNSLISDALADAFDDQVWVTGELHGLRGSPNGHVYFRLVEPGTLGRPSEASLSVVLFRGNKRVVDHVLAKAGGMALTDGIEVRIRGEVLFYAPQGRVQLRMTVIDPSHTLGRLAADRDLLLRTLASEGLLERNRMLSLSPVPLRIGLITSADSAAAADVLHELERSRIGWDITLIDARVQGAGSVEQVVAALTTAARSRLDVVAIVRGGGSRTDLVTFDHEDVARAIAAMPVPVLTGIGHEIDESVADRVAHRAFKTPTACAAFLCETVSAYRSRCDDLWRSLSVRSLELLDRQERHARSLAARVASGARTTVELSAARLAELEGLAGRAPLRTLDAAERHVESLALQTRALDPVQVLARGWTITRAVDGSLIRRIGDAPPGTTLRTSVADGSITSTVTARAPADTPDPTASGSSTT